MREVVVKRRWGEKAWQRRAEEAETGGRTIQKGMYTGVKLFQCDSDPITFLDKSLRKDSLHGSPLQSFPAVITTLPQKLYLSASLLPPRNLECPNKKLGPSKLKD